MIKQLQMKQQDALLPGLKGLGATSTAFTVSMSPQKVKSILEQKMNSQDHQTKKPMLQVRKIDYNLKPRPYDTSYKPYRTNNSSFLHHASDNEHYAHHMDAKPSEFIIVKEESVLFGISMHENQVGKPSQSPPTSQKFPPISVAAAKLPLYDKEFTKRAIKILNQKHQNPFQFRKQERGTLTEQRSQFLEVDVNLHAQSTFEADQQTEPQLTSKHIKNQVSRSSSTPYITKPNLESSRQLALPASKKYKPKNQKSPELADRKQSKPTQLKFDSSADKQVAQTKKHETQPQTYLTPAPPPPRKPRLKRKQPPPPQLSPGDEKIIWKHSQYQTFMRLVNFSNGVLTSVAAGPTITPYKIFIGKGNNHGLIQNSFKLRWWWEEVESVAAVNMIWTQLRQVKFTQSLVPYINTNSKLYQNLRQVPPPAQGYNPQLGTIRKLLNRRHLAELASFATDITLGLDSVESSNFSTVIPNPRIHNHLENNWHLGNKKALFYNMRSYYQQQGKTYSDYMPLTFHIQNGVEDPMYEQFRKTYDQIESKVWIVKPGEMTNRGEGITVCQDITQINEVLQSEQLHFDNRPLTYIVQKYIERPFLYQKRKFDIRSYMLLTSVHGVLKGYWYQEGYIRTASKEYSLRNCNKMVHLTNDAVQKFSDEYGRHEAGNKISFNDFQRYLNSQNLDRKYNFHCEIYLNMKSICRDVVNSVARKIDPNRQSYSFEIYGLDFMIDEQFKVWLIEVNTNPCLELSSPLLSSIIPAMIENAMRIAVDPIFPPPPLKVWPPNKRQFQPDSPFEKNKFELIFDELGLDSSNIQQVGLQEES